MDRCLEAINVDANFIKGILKFFHYENQFLGLHHIRKAAKSGHTEARYVYSVLLMAIGQTEKGIKIINKLTDQEGIAAVDSCCTNMQISLQDINLSMKKIFVVSLLKMKPVDNCHPPEINTACSTCYHFFLMTEFFEMMLGLN